MCGDLEEDTHLDDQLFHWLLANAKAHGAAPDESARALSEPPAAPSSPTWMSQRFRAALSSALTEIATVPEGERAAAVGSQAIVLARLAGFLAGHLPPETDIFRNLVDALMDGNREPEQKANDRSTLAPGNHHGHGHEH